MGEDLPLGPVLPPPVLPLSRPLHVTPLPPELVPPSPVKLVIAVSHWSRGKRRQLVSIPIRFLVASLPIVNSIYYTIQGAILQNSDM